MAAEISPLDAAISSLMAEKSPALPESWWDSWTTACTTRRSRPAMSSMARPSRASSSGMWPSCMGRRSPAPKRSAAAMSRFIWRSTSRIRARPAVIASRSARVAQAMSSFWKNQARSLRVAARSCAWALWASLRVRTTATRLSVAPPARAAIRSASSRRPTSASACAVA